jgi:hypothetical protein
MVQGAGSVGDVETRRYSLFLGHGDNFFGKNQNYQETYAE